jgi:hypothetical protein
MRSHFCSYICSVCLCCAVLCSLPLSPIFYLQPSRSVCEWVSEVLSPVQLCRRPTSCSKFSGSLSALLCSILSYLLNVLSCNFVTLVVSVKFAFGDYCIITWQKFIVFLCAYYVAFCRLNFKMVLGMLFCCCSHGFLSPTNQQGAILQLSTMIRWYQMRVGLLISRWARESSAFFFIICLLKKWFGSCICAAAFFADLFLLLNGCMCTLEHIVLHS